MCTGDRSCGLKASCECYRARECLSLQITPQFRVFENYPNLQHLPQSFLEWNHPGASLRAIWIRRLNHITRNPCNNFWQVNGRTQGENPKIPRTKFTQLFILHQIEAEDAYSTRCRACHDSACPSTTWVHGSGRCGPHVTEGERWSSCSTTRFTK